MKKKRNCTGQLPEVNAYANSHYPPKRRLLSEVCESGSDCDMSNLCNNELLDNNYRFTDYKDNGFIAAKPDDNKNLYVYDSNFNQTDVIPISAPSKYNKKINGLAYDSSSGKIFIAQKNQVFSVTNSGEFIKSELNSQTTRDIATTSGVVSNGCCSNNIVEPNILTAGTSEGNVLLSYEKNGSHYTSKLTESGNLVNPRYVDDLINPVLIYDTECGLHVVTQKESDDGVINYLYTFDKDRSNCKCQNICDDCCFDITCCEDICMEKGLCHIVSSIASIECSLANILHSESEKIKKGICLAKYPDELIELNSSVSKTISNVTMLEQCLCEKLDIALKYCSKYDDCFDDKVNCFKC